MSAPAAGTGVPEDDRYDLGALVVLRVIWQRWWIVAIVLSLSLGMAVRRTNAVVPMYSASATVEITEAQKDWVFGVAGVKSVDPVRTIENEKKKVNSTPVWQAVHDLLGLETSQQISRLTVDSIGVADLIEITVQSPNPDVAVVAADAFARSYIDFRKAQVSTQLNTLAEFLTGRSAFYYDEVSQLDVLIAERSGNQLDLEFYRVLASVASPNAALSADAAIGGDELDGELARLLAEREAALSLATELEKRADEVNLEASITGTGPSMLGDAGNIQGPLGTSAMRELVVAAIAGIAAGLALAFAVDYLDDKLRSRDTVERELVGIPVLGATPMDRGLAGRTGAVATLTRPVGATADAYRSIRAAFIARAESTPVQTVLVTSPDPREGKTTVAAELAVVMARSGRDVVVIDANLRRPRLHRRFGVSQEPGFSSVLAGDKALSSSLVTVPLAGTAGRLRVLPAGPLSDGVTAVLDGRRTVDVLRAIQADADLVVIDAPHVLSISDAQVMAGMVDAAIVVARKKVTKRRRLGAALAAVDRTGVPVIWTVLNGFGRPDKGAARRASRRTVRVDEVVGSRMPAGMR